MAERFCGYEGCCVFVIYGWGRREANVGGQIVGKIGEMDIVQSNTKPKTITSTMPRVHIILRFHDAFIHILFVKNLISLPHRIIHILPPPLPPPPPPPRALPPYPTPSPTQHTQHKHPTRPPPQNPPPSPPPQKTHIPL